ncbi:hypothetical protein [Streptomyces chrestomyceticus]|uniref:hypothetical protein n=1 Tax=Streptomyces chrestomyceticus TaxID=68185 RepID=UPI0033FB10F9
MPETRCPRCGGPLGDRPARSRLTVDREVMVCSVCGQDEAVRQAMGRTPIPFGEWPITR